VKIRWQGIERARWRSQELNWLKQFFSRKQSYKELDEEIAFHLGKRIEELTATGGSRDEATAVAHREFGNVGLMKEKAREAWGWRWLEDLAADLRFGVRMLRKNLVLTLAAILTLALGIGANTAIFTLLYGLVLRSLPAYHVGQLVKVGIASTAEPDYADVGGSYMPYRMMEAVSKEQSSFQELSAWTENDVLMKDREGSIQRYETGLVSGNAFALLGVQPYRGRLIATYDDVRGGPIGGWPVVLSYGFWKEFYGAAEDVVGKQIAISNVPVTVVGITPPDFQGVWPGENLKMYVPMQFAPVLLKKDVLTSPDSFFGVATIARLKPGVTMMQANAEMTQKQGNLFERFIPERFRHDPFFEKAYLTVSSARTGLPNYLTHTYTKPLYLMQGLVGLVLLVCCVNIGGLMMARVAARQQEFAVRTALGASSQRLVRQAFTECLVIAIAGSALGAMGAWYGSELLIGFFRDPMMGEPVWVHPDKTVFWVTALFAVLTTLVFGMLPAWKVARTDPGTLMKTRTTLGGRKQIAGRMLVPIQVALSLVLIMLASLLSESVVKLRDEQTGFDLDHVTIQTSPLSFLELKGEAKLNLYQRMVDRLMEMPAVDSAAVTYQTPMTGMKITGDFQAMGDGPNPPEDAQMPYNEVGPGYFRTMKTKIVEGREFEKNERQFNVCVLNNSAAEFFFPHERALGRYVRNRVTQEFPQAVACQVIGVAEDAKFYDVRQGPPRTIYLPLTKERIDDMWNLVFLINTPTKAQAVAGFRKTLSEIAPTVPLVIFVTLREQMDAALGSQELITLLANFFALLVLLLSALGLYGLLSASVTQRKSEIGVRMALGAKRGTVVWMVLREALGLLGWGVLLGVVLLFFTTRFVESMLHGVSAHDPLTLATVGGTLLVVTILAALVPALRAARLDPMETLRSE
jgi:predicted permease